MALTIVWIGMLLLFWTFSVGIFFYIKGYTAAATKAVGMLNSVLMPYLTELMKDTSDSAREKLSSIMEKVNYFRSTLEKFKLGEL